MPAFLLCRPFVHQRRWSPTGEIQITRRAPGSADALPSWAVDFFDEDNLLDGKFAYQGWALGRYGKQAGSYHIRDDVITLFSNDIINIANEDGLLYFETTEDWKAAIRRQCSENHYIQILLDLLGLMVYSFPDKYAEIFWRHIEVHSREVIESTLLPFLSVVGWQELQSML